MAKRSKPKRLGDEDRSVLESAAMRADKDFARKFSAEPKVKPSAEPTAGESVAEVVVAKGGLAEVKVLSPNGASALPVELYARRADRVNDRWRAGEFEDGLVRFTPLTITGASNGWIKDETARLVRCQLINADLEAPWAVRIKVRDA
jgi:hypothetical protein